MFGYSEWIKFIKCLLKSVRTSGCIVISEIGSHTNYATEPLYCPVHNIQEDLFFCQRNMRERKRHGPSFTHTDEAWDQPSVHVCPLQQAGFAKLGMQDTQRFELVQRIPRWFPSSRILLDICSHHQPDGPTGRRAHSWIWIQKQPFFYPNPMFLCACGWLFGCRRVNDAYSWPTWWTCE